MKQQNENKGQPASSAGGQEPIGLGIGVHALAAEISEAVRKDEANEGCDISAGLFGREFTALIRKITNVYLSRPIAELEHAQPASSAPKWKEDCQGKRDYDGALLSVSTRAWPAHYRADNKPSAAVHIIAMGKVVRAIDVVRDTEAEVTAEVERIVSAYAAKAAHSADSAAPSGWEICDDSGKYITYAESVGMRDAFLFGNPAWSAHPRYAAPVAAEAAPQQAVDLGQFREPVKAVDLGQFREPVKAAFSRLARIVNDDATKWSERQQASIEQAALYPLLAMIDSQQKGSHAGGQESEQQLTKHGVRALSNSIRELRSLVDHATDLDFDEMTVGALQTAIESMEMRQKVAPVAAEAAPQAVDLGPMKQLIADAAAALDCKGDKKMAARLMDAHGELLANNRGFSLPVS